MVTSKSILIFVLSLLVVLPIIFADHTNTNAPDKSALLKAQFVVSQPKVVYDIPFDVVLNVDTGDKTLVQYKLKATSSDTKATLFSSYSDLSKFSIQPDTKLEGSSMVVAYTIPDASVKFNSKTLAKLGQFNGLNVKGKVTNPINIISDPAYSLTKFTALATDASAFTVQWEGFKSFTPEFSKCGDGVVGYLDGYDAATQKVDEAKMNGIKDNNEPNEACDPSTDANKEKCVNCNYVAIGYIPVNCGFGSYSCTIKKMNSKELFLARVTALVNGNCYPDATHPAAEFCDLTTKKPTSYYTDGKIDGEKKLEFIIQFGRILKEFFIGLPN